MMLSPLDAGTGHAHRRRIRTGPPSISSISTAVSPGS